MLYEVKMVIKSTLALLRSLIQVPARNWCMLKYVTLKNTSHYRSLLEKNGWEC